MGIVMHIIQQFDPAREYKFKAWSAFQTTGRIYE